MNETIKEIVDHWLSITTRRGSEHVDCAVGALRKASADNAPAAITTLICPNFEVVKCGKKREVTIHDSFIHDVQGNLRRGYVAMEEIASAHQTLGSIGTTVHHSVIIVDNAIQWQPDGAENATERGKNILQALINNRLEDRGIAFASARIARLSTVIPVMKERFEVDFDACWKVATAVIWEVLEEQHHRVAGLVRREVKKETRYLTEVWGVTTEDEAKKSLIRDQYALTATIGRLLPHIHAAIWNTELKPRNQHVLIDAIKGPKEDTHNAEYELYNVSFPELDHKLNAIDNSPLGILRIITGTALWSEIATDEAPITGKSLESLRKESWEVTENGIVPD